MCWMAALVFVFCWSVSITTQPGHSGISWQSQSQRPGPWYEYLSSVCLYTRPGLAPLPVICPACECISNIYSSCDIVYLCSLAFITFWILLLFGPINRTLAVFLSDHLQQATPCACDPGHGEDVYLNFSVLTAQQEELLGGARSFIEKIRILTRSQRSPDVRGPCGAGRR